MTAAPLQLNVELARLRGIVVSIDVQVLWLETDELRLIELDNTSTGFVDGEETPVLWVALKAKLLERADVIVKAFPLNKEAAIAVWAPRKAVKKDFTVLLVENPLSHTIVGGERHANIEAVIIGELVVIGPKHVFGCREHIHIFLLEQDVKLLISVSQRYQQQKERTEGTHYSPDLIALVQRHAEPLTKPVLALDAVNGAGEALILIFRLLNLLAHGAVHVALGWGPAFTD